MNLLRSLARLSFFFVRYYSLEVSDDEKRDFARKLHRTPEFRKKRQNRTSISFAMLFPSLFHIFSLRRDRRFTYR